MSNSAIKKYTTIGIFLSMRGEWDVVGMVLDKIN